MGVSGSGRGLAWLLPVAGEGREGENSTLLRAGGDVGSWGREKEEVSLSSRCVSVGACVTVFWSERGKWLTTLHSFCPACPGPRRRMGCAQPVAAVPGRGGGHGLQSWLAFGVVPP